MQADDGQGGAGNASLTVAQAFTNAGTIDLSQVNFYYGDYFSDTLTVSSGTLANAGSITSSVGTHGGARTLAAQLDNQAGGTITVNQPLTIARASAQDSNEGTITVNAGLTISQSGTSPSFTNTGTISIAASQALAVNSGAVDQNGGTIGGAGSLALNSLTLNLSTGFTNAVTGLSLYNSTVNGPGTLTNAAGQALTLFSDTVNAPLVNQGTLVAVATDTIAGTLSNAAGAVLRVQADDGQGGAGNASLTVAQAFTNAGTIDLSQVNFYYGDYFSDTLTVSSGTLANAGSITSSVGTHGGARTLAAQLDNQAGGTITVNQPLTIARASAQDSNEGTITVNAGLTISQSGTSPSFTNTGTISIAASQALAVSGGTFGNFQNGTLTGGTYQISGTLQFPNAAITTDAANITLSGTSSQIIDQSGNNALANLADISAGGAFSLQNGRNFTAALGLSNDGSITVGTGSTLTANVYQVGGQTNVLGTLSGTSTTPSPPDAGSAVAFNGISDYATVPDQPSLRLTSTVTIEFWARRERFGTDIVLEKGGDWTEGQTDYGVAFNTYPNGTNGMFYFYYAGGWRGTSGVTDFGWHYYAVVATQGATNPVLYIDGVAEPVQYSGGSGTIDLNPSTSPLYLGAQVEPRYPYYGESVLDDVSIWNIALSQSTIQADMNQTLAGTESGLVAYWQFNEGLGGVAYDKTANHNDASLGGGNTADAPSWVPSGPIGVDIAGGTLTGTGTINASVLNAGTVQVNPPGGTGLLAINGNYTQAATGELNVNIGGLAAGSQFDQLNVSGAVTLAGGLNINLVNGYTPPSGDSYRILTFGSRTGDFTVETGLFLGGGEGFSPTYDSSGLDLVVIPEEAGTTTTVASSPNPSSYGQSVTFTATVASTISTSLIPTGTVTFYDGASTLGAATLNGSGMASFTTSLLITGSHSIIAQYRGDSNFSGSNSTALAQSVNQDGSGTVVTSSSDPSTYGQSVTFTATVTAAGPGSGTPTGTVTFYDGPTPLGSMTLNNGVATLTTSALASASHSITASYGGDANFTASTSTAITQSVSQDGSVTTLNTSSINPSVFGQAVTFTATVAAAAPGSGTPTGSVTFYDGSTDLGTAGLSGGSASLTTSALAVGSHSITASYDGDANFTTSSSTALTQGVNQDGSATVVIGVPYPSVIGQAVTFTATVTAAAPGSGTPTGSVTFYDGSTFLDTATLSAGSAAFTTSALALGSHSITAVYGGDTNFTGSTSPVFTQLVNEYASTTAVSSSAQPSAYGQSVTFTATVSAIGTGEGTPTGSVTFYDGSNALDTAMLSGGTATFTTSSLAAGTYSITAVYSGDSNFNGSTSTALVQVVNQDGTATVVTSSVNPSVATQAVTFTATVTASAPGSGTPTGSVTFYDGSTPLDIVTLSGGSAAFTTTALALGDHAISVGYGGDTNFSGSTAAAITQTVNVPPPATLSGVVYNDLSGDGVLQSGDPGLSGWTVQLLDSSNNVVATTATDAGGDYSFTNVYPGSYTVAVTGQAGYLPTVPASQTLAVTAPFGQTLTGEDLGEFQTVMIGGEVFDDLSDSGTSEGGRPRPLGLDRRAAPRRAADRQRRPPTRMGTIRSPASGAGLHDRRMCSSRGTSRPSRPRRLDGHARERRQCLGENFGVMQGAARWRSPGSRSRRRRCSRARPRRLVGRHQRRQPADHGLIHRSRRHH